MRRFDMFGGYRGLMAPEDGTGSGGESESLITPPSAADGKDQTSPSASGIDLLADVDDGKGGKGFGYKYGEETLLVGEKFIKDGKLDVGGLLKSYTEAEKKINPAARAPETYELAPPEGVDKEVFEVMFAKDDPVLAGFNEIARAEGMSQEGYTKVMGLLAQSLNSSIMTTKEAEFQALGKDAAVITDRVGKFFASKLDEKNFATARAFATTAEGVRLLDSIRAMFVGGGKMPLGDGDGGDVGKLLTHAELRAIQEKDDYWTNPDLQKQVAEGYRQLAGSK